MDTPVNLDSRRGMNAQKDTELRRQLATVQADQAALAARRIEFEELSLAEPAATQKDAIEKAKYVIELYAATAEGGDPRRSLLIVRTLDDLDRHFNVDLAQDDGAAD